MDKMSIGLLLTMLCATLSCDDPVRQINNNKGDACKEKAKPPNLIEEGQYIMDHRTGLCFWTNDIRPGGFGNGFSLSNVPCSFKVMQLAGEGDIDEEQIKKEKQQHE